MPLFEEYNYAQHPWLTVIIGTIVSGLLLFLFRWLIINRLRALTNRTQYRLDSLLVHALSLPLTVIALAILFIVAEKLLNFTELLSPSEFSLSPLVVQVLCIVSILIFLDRFVNGFIGNYSDRSDIVKNSKGIVQGVFRGLIIGIGTLVLLGTMGISITPLVASLGISSLAVALALQPTLENFFSGIQLVFDKPIRIGDFIELESGEQGFVEKIGWRSTWIKMLPNNMVIMPNSSIAKSKIINYFYPEKELSVPVEVGVHYSSDLEHVEKVTLEVAREVLVAHEWGVDEYNTFVVYTAFDSSSINFTVMLRAKEYFNRFWVKSAFIKALHKRYALEGIVIPFPIRAINTDQESAVLPIKQNS